MSFLETVEGAVASTAQPAAISQSQPQTVPPPPGEMVRLIAFGSPAAVRATIKSLHRCRYADPNDWSRLLPTGRVGEMMAILTKRETLTTLGEGR
ncbi:MAG: hypothetical protein AAFR42_13945 [Cyanobacteria bacterium J06628_6]